MAIDVKAMDKGQGFEIIYYSKLPDIAATPGTFTATASTRRTLAEDGEPGPLPDSRGGYSGNIYNRWTTAP